MMKMRKAIIALLVATCLITSVCALGVSAESANQVTADMNATVQQGSGGYCYIYLDDLTDLSSLTVAIHYDTEKVTIFDSYNLIACTLYDSSNQKGCLQYSYIFDGEGSNDKSCLFYFYYQINENADIGDSFFDIIVSDAYNADLETINISGSRCRFSIVEQPMQKNCYIYSTYSVSTSVKEEFEIGYHLSTWEIASGSLVLSYDPELFEFVGLSQGELLGGKVVDVNESLTGAVAISFVGTTYHPATDLMTVKFRTRKNVAETSEIKMTVRELYDLNLSPYTCGGFTTEAIVAFDETYTEDATSMMLGTAYEESTGKVTVTVNLGKDSMLGAGDFVLKFDTDYLTYNVAEKGFFPTFFNINDKNVSDGILKFSIISLSDITDEQIVLTVTFDAKHACEDKLADFEISGSGLTDALTNTIVLNFVDASVTIPLKHTEATAVIENKVNPTCTEDGSYENVVYCSVCGDELSRVEATTEKLGHDHATEWTVDVKPACTTMGSKSHHCSRCDDKADVTEIPARGHKFGEWYETKAPTCTETGTDERECSVCHTKETRTTDANGHTEAEAVIENKVNPTCTEDGSYENVVYCSVCGDELSRVEATTEKLGHDHATEWTVDVEPACATVGSKSHHCSRCGDKADVTEIPAKGHRESDVLCENVVEATCTEDGSYEDVVYCSVCGDEVSRVEVVIEKLGHNHLLLWTVDVKPTCTTVGSRSHHCSRCDDKADVTEIPAKGHRFGEWYETKAPTCTETGTDERECSVCHTNETRTTDANGHTEAEAVIENKVNPTCTEDGSCDSVVYCSVCGDELSRVEITIEKLGHSFTEYVSNNDATYTEDGTKTAQCDRCTITDTQIDVGSAFGLAQKFKDEMAAFSEDDTLETAYAKLYAALQAYSMLSETEKENVTEEYAALQEKIATYNAKVQVANCELSDAIELALTPIASMGLTFLAALWFLLKSRFFK